MNYERFFSLEYTLFRIFFQSTIMVAFEFEDISSYQDVISNFAGVIIGYIIAEMFFRLIYYYFIK